jgi:CPA2 family monovalent cation:H+ antiporter-2
MIVARTFAEEKVDEKVTGIVFGVLIVQDLAAVLLLAILTTVAKGGGAADAVAWTAGELAAFLLAAVVVGYLLIPRAVRLVARLGSRETLLIASVGLCFASALLAHKLGYSVALGAFLAGSLIAESGHATEIEELVAPLRDLFAAVFFVAVGMIVDPAVILDSWMAVVALSLLVLVAQPTLVSFGTFVAGNDVRSSVRAGMSLGQIGEFSFIIAGIGVAAGAIRDFLYPVAVATCVITSFLTPWMVRSSSRQAQALERRLPHSVQTYTTLYASWREALRARKANRSTAARIRRLIILLVVDGLALAGIFIAGVVIHERYLSRIEQRFGMAEDLALILLITLGLALAIPFAIGLTRCVRNLGRALATRVIPSVEEGSLDLAAAPRRAFIDTLQVVMALLVGLPLLALTQPFLPGPIGPVILAAILAVLGVSFWKSANNLDEHVKAGANLVVEVLLNQAKDAAPARPLHEVQTMLPGLGNLSSVPLRADSPAIGRTLIDLNLRGLTGASVLTINRHDGAIVAPTGREVLAAGDVLGLTGTTDAVSAATALLLGESPG